MQQALDPIHQRLDTLTTRLDGLTTRLDGLTTITTRSARLSAIVRIWLSYHHHYDDLSSL